MASTVMSGKIGGLSFFFLPILGKVGIAQCIAREQNLLLTCYMELFERFMFSLV